jgi:hypothetical protein
MAKFSQPVKFSILSFMTKIINLQKYQTRVIEQRGFEPWLKRFGESYGQTTRLSDISDRTIYFLAVPGELGNVAFYELIMGILDLGEASEFHEIDRDKQMQVMDIHLFLVDIVRFEMMHRLGWIDKLACLQGSHPQRQRILHTPPAQ